MVYVSLKKKEALLKYLIAKFSLFQWHFIWNMPDTGNLANQTRYSRQKVLGLCKQFELSYIKQTLRNWGYF